MTPHPRVRLLPARLRVLLALLLGAVTAYLLLDRSHAEEVGGGARVLAEIVRGERPLSPLTWLVFASVPLVVLIGGRRSSRVRVRSPHGY